MDSAYVAVAVAGSGACLGGAADTVVQLPGVPDTDLRPVTARVRQCPDPDPVIAPRSLPRESRLALAAAVPALAGGAPVPGGTGVGTVWVSSTAGMDEYGHICVQAATLAPGLASPAVGPHAAYNGPASMVSIRLGLTGPQLTLTGGCDAGAASFVEASRMLHEGQCEFVVVGGSATVSRWRLAGADDGPVLAEGAISLLLGRVAGPARGTTARPLRRARLRPSDVELDRFVDKCLAELRASPSLIVASVAPPWRAAAKRTLSGRHTPDYHIEERCGDLGAASGLAAVAFAVAACAAADADPSSALVLALGSTGNAVAIEVVSKE